MKRMLVAAVVALAAAAPAGAALSTTTHTARGSGTVLVNGTTGASASFSLDFSKGKGHKVVFVSRKSGIAFHSQGLTSLRFTSTAVKISGWGIANGRRVHFVAIATQNPSPLGDWFKISWGGGPSYGGRLTTGSIDIATLSMGGSGGVSAPSAA